MKMEGQKHANEAAPSLKWEEEPVTQTDTGDDLLQLHADFESMKWPHQQELLEHQQRSSSYFARKSVGNGGESTEGTRRLSPKERAEEALHLLSSSPDAALQSMLLSLFQWLGDGRASSDRTVRIVSCGWAQGKNFEVVSKSQHGTSLRIVHENLLGTTSKKPVCSICAIANRLIN